MEGLGAPGGSAIRLGEEFPCRVEVRWVHEDLLRARGGELFEQRVDRLRLAVTALDPSRPKEAADDICLRLAVRNGQDGYLFGLHVRRLLQAAGRRSIASSVRVAIASNAPACQSSPEMPAGTSGTLPSRGSPVAQSDRSSATGEKTSICSPQCGQTRPLMFSTPPSTGTSPSRRKSRNLRPSRCATSCGPTTITAPSRDKTPSSCC